jgi:hypothetical protein
MGRGTGTGGVSGYQETGTWWGIAYGTSWADAIAHRTGVKRSEASGVLLPSLHSHPSPELPAPPGAGRAVWPPVTDDRARHCDLKVVCIPALVGMSEGDGLRLCSGVA